MYDQLKNKITSSDVIAAGMVTSSSLAHLVENPLVIHPRYEYAENRRRSKFFNRAYGYTETEYMYNFFRSLGVHYVVLTYEKCFMPVENAINMRNAIHLDFPKQTPDLV